MSALFIIMWGLSMSGVVIGIALAYQAFGNWPADADRLAVFFYRAGLCVATYGVLSVILRGSLE